MLIDEAAGLIERTPSFGHVVVDEAQDLSPMQCRAVARRSEHGSVTVLGDLAQGTTPWAATDWRGALAHLGKPDAAVVPLTVGFRVPAAVVAFANRLLPALAVDVPPADVAAPRRRRWTCVRVTDLTAATVAEVRAALAHEGSVGVIAADAAVAGLRAALRRGRRRDRDRRRRRRPRSGSPWCRPRWPRAWSTTTWWWSSRPRSWRPSRAGCTGCTWCSPGRCPGWPWCTPRRCRRRSSAGRRLTGPQRSPAGGGRSRRVARGTATRTPSAKSIRSRFGFSRYQPTRAVDGRARNRPGQLDLGLRPFDRR